MYRYFCRVNSQKKNFWAKVCAHIQSFDRFCQIAFKELYYFPLQQSLNGNACFLAHSPILYRINVHNLYNLIL